MPRPPSCRPRRSSRRPTWPHSTPSSERVASMIATAAMTCQRRKQEAGSRKRYCHNTPQACASRFPLPVSRFRVAFDALPPRAQPAPDLGFESVLGGVVVDVASYTVREILLRYKTARVVVRILVAPAMAEMLHRLRMPGIPQVHRHRPGPLQLRSAAGGADRPDHC